MKLRERNFFKYFNQFAQKLFLERRHQHIVIMCLGLLWTTNILTGNSPGSAHSWFSSDFSLIAIVDG